MLNRDILYRADEKKTLLRRGAVTAIVGLLGLAAGLWLGSSVLDSSGDKISRLQSDLETANSESQFLAAELAAAAQMKNTLQAQLSDAEEQMVSALQTLTQMESDMEMLSSAGKQAVTLEEQIQSIQSQMESQQSNLETLTEMSDSVEKHRLLLVELRKDLPLTREDSVAYWNTMKAVASNADPALAPPVDRIILKIDNYFDWNERTPSPTAPADYHLDWLAEYSISGAIDYEDASVTFTKEALLSVISQMDTVVSSLN